MAKSRGQKKAREVIADECRGEIHREFPSEFLDKTIDEIRQAAGQRNRRARKALKLLNENRFKKQ